MDPVQHLHAVVRCLTDTQRNGLFQRIINVTDSLLLCRTLLVDSKSASLNNKWSAEAISLSKRFQKLLSSLLHSASAEEQWTASYLLKHIVNFDNIEEIQNLGEWAKGLLALFSRPSTLYTIKIISLVTLTRIFTFGKEKSRLLRDVTTYLLPKLITTCINILEAPYGSSSAKYSLPLLEPLLESILLCFSKLIPCHPTLFRSSKTQLQKLLTRIIAPASHVSNNGVHKNDGWNIQASTNASSTAMRLYVQLHYLAPKNEVAKEWATAEGNVIAAIHTLLYYLKAHKPGETWSVTANGSRSLTTETRSGLDELGFPSTGSVHDAEKQLLALIDLLKHFLAIANLSQVEIRLAPILDVMQRVVFSIGPAGYKFNEQKRPLTDDMPIFLDNWASLYDHIIKLASTVLSRFGLAAMSVAREIMFVMTVAFERGSTIESLRNVFYMLLEQLVQLIGPTMTKSRISVLHGMITSCCRDILDSTGQLQQSSTRKTLESDHSDTLQSGREKLDNRLTTTVSCTSEGYSPPTQDYTRKSAISLLEVLLSKLPPDLIPSSTRSLMERTAILSQSKGAMLASILNRPSVKSSGGKVVASPLPFLARLHPDCLETEGLLRPRVPILAAAAAVNDKATVDRNSDSALLAGEENEFGAHMNYRSSDQFIDTSQIEFFNDVRHKRGVENFETDSPTVQKRARHYNDKADVGTSDGFPLNRSSSEAIEKKITVQNGVSTATPYHPATDDAVHTITNAHHDGLGAHHDNISTGKNHAQSLSKTNKPDSSNQTTTLNTTDIVSNTNTNTTLSQINNRNNPELEAKISKTTNDEQDPNVRSELIITSVTTNNNNNNNNDENISHDNPIPPNLNLESEPDPKPDLDSDNDSDDSESFTIPPLVMSSALQEQLAAVDADEDDDDGEDGEDAAV